MEKNTKLLLGIGAIAVAGYLLMKPKKKQFFGMFRTPMGFAKSNVTTRYNRRNQVSQALQAKSIDSATGCSKGGSLLGYDKGDAVYSSNSGNAPWRCREGVKIAY
jgi:hypothetical protein